MPASLSLINNYKSKRPLVFNALVIIIYTNKDNLVSPIRSSEINDSLSQICKLNFFVSPSLKNFHGLYYYNKNITQYGFLPFDTSVV